MDAQGFDTLVRTLGSTASRRVAFRTLGVGTVAAVVGLRSGDAGAATCRRRQSVCSRGKHCCGHKRGVVCQPLSTGTTCLTGRRCCVTQGKRCDNDHCNCCEGFLCSAVTSRCEKQ